MNWDICPLTGQRTLYETNEDETIIKYSTPATGCVILETEAFHALQLVHPNEKYILAGICRNKDIRNEEPLQINTSFLQQLENQDIPYSFMGRAKHLLEYLYNNGGLEFRPHTIDTISDSPITFSSPQEFHRIIKYLEDEKWIAYDTVTPTKHSTTYRGLVLTKEGRKQIEKEQPPIFIINLINQRIDTGNIEIDSHIEHARIQFFGENSSMTSKRSACETLMYVIERLRDELKALFHGDTEKFFHIVNEFNIRHNKERTKTIEHEEMLEWLFFGLLNTINTYIKMKKKLG